MPRDTEYLNCPLCGITWALVISSSGPIPPGGVEVTPDKALIHIKQSEGAKGFKTVETLSIVEAMRDPRYQPLVRELRRRCQRFLALTSGI